MVCRSCGEGGGGFLQLLLIKSEREVRSQRSHKLQGDISSLHSPRVMAIRSLLSCRRDVHEYNL